MKLIVPENLDTENISDCSDEHKHLTSRDLKTQRSFLTIGNREDSDLRVEDTITFSATKQSIATPRNDDEMFLIYLKELQEKHRLELKRLKFERNQSMVRITENFEETIQT